MYASLLLAWLFLPLAQAEYRAYELVINNSVTGQERVVLSSLDPDQYRGYYPMNPGETVTFRSTWMCKGNTSDRPVCPKTVKPGKP